MEPTGTPTSEMPNNFPIPIENNANFLISIGMKYEDIQSVRDVFIYEKEIHPHLFTGSEYQNGVIRYKILDEGRPSLLQMGEKYFYDFGKDKIIPTEDLLLDEQDGQLTPEALSELLNDLKEQVIGENPNPSISRSNSADQLIDPEQNNEGPIR